LTNRDAQKRAAAERAVEHVASGMRLGLGTGSTARHVVDVVAAKLRDGTLRDIVAVPTSRATETHARSLGIPLTTLDDVAELDLAIDGADEIDPEYNMIKGGGGALLREKLVARRSRRVVIAVEPRKLVKRLGEGFALPIEVVPPVWRVVADELSALGAAPRLRGSNGEPFRSDNGNYIIDARFAGIDRPAELARRLDDIPGVVETGLFIGLCHLLVVGRGDGATAIEPTEP
jgi:ribose 5-phosphate isomerase A